MPGLRRGSRCRRDRRARRAVRPIAGTTASFAPVGECRETPAVAGAAPAEGPVLVVRKGPQPGERFYLDRPRLTIGRDPESDIFLNDMTVSRTHAVARADRRRR